jgi:hypothetical protein
MEQHVTVLKLAKRNNIPLVSTRSAAAAMAAAEVAFKSITRFRFGY